MPILAFIGLGSNLGEPDLTLTTAVERLAAIPLTTVAQCSKFYRSEPIDSVGPDFVNAAALLATTLGPFDLLRELQAIELQFGRERPFRNAPRTLDLDILLYGEMILDTPSLQLPHPRLHTRRFALAPLADLAPNLSVPGHGAVADLLGNVGNQVIVELQRERSGSSRCCT